MNRRNFLKTLTVITGFSAFGKPNYAEASVFSSEEHMLPVKNKLLSELNLSEKLENFLCRLDYATKLIHSSSTAREEYLVDPDGFFSRFGINYQLDLDDEDRAIIKLGVDKNFKSLLRNKQYGDIVKILKNNNLIDQQFEHAWKKQFMEEIRGNMSIIKKELEQNNIHLTWKNSNSLAGDLYLAHQNGPRSSCAGCHGGSSAMSVQVAVLLAIAGAVTAIVNINALVNSTIAAGTDYSVTTVAQSIKCHASSSEQNNQVSIKLSRAIDYEIQDAIYHNKVNDIVECIATLIKENIEGDISNNEMDKICKILKKTIVV